MPSDREPPAGVQRILNDIRSLNSSVLLISQKIKYIVRNEKILGRNFIVLNRKLKTIEEKIAAGALGGGAGGMDNETMQAVLKRLEETNRRLAQLEVELDDVRQTTASKEKIQEMKYVVDAINPLEYVTLEQVKQMMGGKKKK